MVAATLVIPLMAKRSTVSLPALAAEKKSAVVVLDPGHNGGNGSHPKEINRIVDIGTKKKACNTVGASTASGFTEHEYNFDLAKRVKRELEALGIAVLMTRTSDDGVGPCIHARAAIANNAKAAALVAIHADGGPPKGRGFFVIKPALVKGLTDSTVGPSAVLADSLVAAIRLGTDMPLSTYVGRSGLLTSSDYGTLNLAKVATVILETGNMRNKTDAALLESDAWRDKMAKSIAVGLSAFVLRTS